MVKWTTPAKQDLKQIHDYIAKDSNFYAKKVTDEIVASSENLESFPQMGRIVPEIGDTNVRELVVYSYRLVYEIVPAGIRVLALIHGKRDFLSLNIGGLAGASS